MNRIFHIRALILACLLSPSGLCADVVVAWNNALLDSFRTENTHPCVAARALAIVHGAMYDTSAAVNHTAPFFATERSEDNLPNATALNSAAYCAATNLFPSRAGAFKDLYARLVGEIPESPRRPQAIRLGSAIADAWISWRINDGSSGSIPYIPSKEPGAWRRTPAFMRPPEMQSWAKVIPFTLVSAAQFRPPGPPALSSARYAEDLNAVKELGGAKSSTRTAAQTETARFWSDFSYTATPPGHWNLAAQAVALARGMTLEEKVKLFAVLNLTLNDVALACWDSKYVFNFWRPVTAIRAADTDGNDATEPQADWMPLLNSPAFQDYVSGHSAFSGAGAVVLAHFNGGDAIHFSIPSDNLPGKTRSYESLWACAEEVSRSRLYAGIHFPSALNDGLQLGRQVAQYVLDHHFRPTATPILFTSVGELDKSPWLGVIARPGSSITIETQASTGSGQWTVWTNAIAATPTTRWPLEKFQNASAFRLRPQ